MPIVPACSRPQDDAHDEWEFDLHSKMWTKVDFPSRKPSSRHEVMVSTRSRSMSTTSSPPHSLVAPIHQLLLLTPPPHQPFRTCVQQRLEEWLDNALKRVDPSAVPPCMDGVAIGEQEVLFICLHELARQVYVHCEERGRLLMRVQQYVTVQ